MRNEDTPEDQIEWVDENGKIYNSIFTFKEDPPIEKRMVDLFKIESYAKKRSATYMSY